MARRPLFHQVDEISEKPKNHKPHTISFKTLIGRDGMRLIGRARDRGIIKD